MVGSVVAWMLFVVWPFDELLSLDDCPFLQELSWVMLLLLLLVCLFVCLFAVFLLFVCCCLLLFACLLLFVYLFVAVFVVCL